MCRLECPGHCNSGARLCGQCVHCHKEPGVIMRCCQPTFVRLEVPREGRSLGSACGVISRRLFDCGGSGAAAPLPLLLRAPLRLAGPPAAARQRRPFLLLAPSPAQSSHTAADGRDMWKAGRPCRATSARPVPYHNPGGPPPGSRGGGRRRGRGHSQPPYAEGSCLAAGAGRRAGGGGGRRIAVGAKGQGMQAGRTHGGPQGNTGIRRRVTLDC